MSSKERVARFRFVKSLENTASKLQLQIAKAPPGFTYPIEFELRLMDMLGHVVGAQVEFIDTEDQVGIRFMFEKTDEQKTITEDAVLTIPQGHSEYHEWKLNEDSKIATKIARQKLSRNAFCEQVLGAKLTNSRWGWVGVKEPKNAHSGELYIFGWEHNRGRDGMNTLGLFKTEVGIDKSGRRMPGHRDALEKIKRVQSGELEPYIVWQSAVDSRATPKVIESRNHEFVTACDLYVDSEGYWTAKLLDSKPLA